MRCKILNLRPISWTLGEGERGEDRGGRRECGQSFAGFLSLRRFRGFALSGRHGTTTLFAALDVKAGTIVGKCMPRHRTQEFRKFLDEIERNVPTDLDMHVVMDNASSHKTKLIRSWFVKRSRWHAHFTPTSSSWVNQVERFFALLSEQQIKRGAHRSVADLEAAITAYLKIRNAAPKPFRWTKSAGDILASIERFCRRTLDTHAKCA